MIAGKQHSRKSRQPGCVSPGPEAVPGSSEEAGKGLTGMIFLHRSITAAADNYAGTYPWNTKRTVLANTVLLIRRRRNEEVISFFTYKYKH